MHPKESPHHHFPLISAINLRNHHFALLVFSWLFASGENGFLRYFRLWLFGYFTLALALRFLLLRLFLLIAALPLSLQQLFFLWRQMRLSSQAPDPKNFIPLLHALLQLWSIGLSWLIPVIFNLLDVPGFIVAGALRNRLKQALTEVLWPNENRTVLIDGASHEDWLAWEPILQVILIVLLLHY